jgi:hypothetical protein
MGEHGAVGEEQGVEACGPFTVSVAPETIRSWPSNVVSASVMRALVVKVAAEAEDTPEDRRQARQDRRMNINGRSEADETARAPGASFGFVSVVGSFCGLWRRYMPLGGITVHGPSVTT